ncbi:ribosomal RNA-processing protein 7-domain-containing protein [Rhodofomes roseus]|uniref:Ribosomal RNA-processing protein 7-domain-containing protein n=1 Tax=Rhodofomes roseus TaxID=34475 RepID=A0ABQ8K8X9_9APHY|nr:ribosomal RNA-processing protein 7-domain-containing protein [Rhodofomes roseus]KAH9833777.1 ribosomal RNA-processing protein 7-domain-containing protein [Rhodofomes roseus]
MSTTPKSVGGFTPISVAYSSTATHVFYARAHSNPKPAKSPAQQDSKGKGKEAVYPEGRTLFLVNLPPDATERELTLFFKAAGTVERIAFDADGEVAGGEDDLGDSSDSEEEDEEDEAEAEAADEPAERPRKKRKTGKQDSPPEVTPLPTPTLRTLRRTGRSAHLVFLDASSLSRALSPPSSTSSPAPNSKSSPKPRPWPTDAAAPLGLAHYLAAHTALRPPLDAVRAHADTAMARFEWAQARARRASKYRMGEAVVDADGFTLVTRGGAYGKTLGGGVGVASKRFQEEAAGGKAGAGKRYRKKKTEKTEKEGFYAFQVHEKKRKELMDLKAKWQEDKAKVEKLKHSRRFKPY